jgi:hypothetical protein
MKNKYCQKVGTTIQFSKTVDRDQFPRIPFSNGIAGGPDTEPAMSKVQRFAYSIVLGFAIGVIFLVP